MSVVLIYRSLDRYRARSQKASRSSISYLVAGLDKKALVVKVVKTHQDTLSRPEDVVACCKLNRRHIKAVGHDMAGTLK